MLDINRYSAAISPSTTSHSSQFVTWHWRRHLSSTSPPCTLISHWRWLRLRFTHRHMGNRIHHRMAFINLFNHRPLLSWLRLATNKLVVSPHQTVHHPMLPFSRLVDVSHPTKTNSKPPIMVGCTIRTQPSCRRMEEVMGKIVEFLTAQPKSSSQRLSNINTRSNKSRIVSLCEGESEDRNKSLKSNRQKKLIRISITLCGR